MAFDGTISESSFLLRGKGRDLGCQSWLPILAANRSSRRHRNGFRNKNNPIRIAKTPTARANLIGFQQSTPTIRAAKNTVLMRHLPRSEVTWWSSTPMEN